ncbi:phage holin family protein [Candidatus Gracilibacteria bacterium]|nr:phage holin family protein [Candidatus Gracilibacteria bacterium]
MTEHAPQLDPPARSSEPSIAALLGEVVADAQTLVRKEIELATAEVKVEINKARDGAISLGIGAAVAGIGGIFLLLMLVHGLVEWFGLSFWLSYLIVGGILAIVGGIMLYMGLQRLKTVDPMPRETIDSVRKDVEWIREQSQ